MISGVVYNELELLRKPEIIGKEFILGSVYLRISTVVDRCAELLKLANATDSKAKDTTISRNDNAWLLGVLGS